MKKNDKKTINAWVLYDWANSVYPLVITSTIFPIYYAAVTSLPGTDKVHFLGMDIVNTALYSYALSFSFLIIAAVSPLLSAIADYSGNKKSFMRFFCYLGAISCSALYFFIPGMLWVGILGFMFASIGYSGSIVFYNAYLPEIADPSEQDKVSARGFAMGYIGSSILLILNLLMVQHPGWFGIPPGTMAARISFLLVGLWWILFSGITFRYLPGNTGGRKVQSSIVLRGYRELLGVWRELKHTRVLKRFLLSFFIYNMGVQTVMNVAALFGTKVLKLESTQLITTILIIQFVAVGGAYLFSALSKLLGNITALSISVFTWIGVCVAAYYVEDARGFYILAFMVGIVMGGIQSLSRSTYSKLLPAGTANPASYFSFFDVCDKLGYFFGIASFGLIEDFTGNMRNSIIALIVFFLAGLFFLIKIKK